MNSGIDQVLARKLMDPISFISLFYRKLRQKHVDIIEHVDYTLAKMKRMELKLSFNDFEVFQKVAPKICLKNFSD